MNRIILAAKVRSLQKARAENGQQLQKRLKETRQRGVTGDDLQEIYADYGPEDVLYEDEIHELWTRYLREKAERLLLPLPPMDDENYWEESRVTSRKLLTRKGIDEVRRSIRRELHERRSGWLTWVAALTGLVGAISGLVAIISSNF